MTTLRAAVASTLARHRFRCVGASINAAHGSQIRSFSFYPTRNSSFTLGTNSIFSGRLSMEREGAIICIGERTYVGKSLLAASSSIEIGSDVLISWGVTIIDHHSHAIEFSKRNSDVVDWLDGKKDWTQVSVRPVRICDKVWIGFGAAILPGVTVGQGAVVGACSVVTRDVPEWCVVAGNPARILRKLEDRVYGSKITTT